MEDHVAQMMTHPASLNLSSTLTTDTVDFDSQPKRPKTVGRAVRSEYQSKICKSAERRKRQQWNQSIQVDRPVEVPQVTRLGNEQQTGLDGLVVIPSFKPFADFQTQIEGLESQLIKL